MKPAIHLTVTSTVNIRSWFSVTFCYTDCWRWSCNSLNFWYEVKFGSCCHVTTFERLTNNISDALCVIIWTLIGSCQIKKYDNCIRDGSGKFVYYVWPLDCMVFPCMCWNRRWKLKVIKDNSISPTKFLFLSICCRLESLHCTPLLVQSTSTLLALEKYIKKICPDLILALESL